MLFRSISSFRTACRRYTVSPHFGSLGVALWVVMAFYNFTEAAFGPGLLWCALLLLVLVVPRSNELPAREMQQVDKTKIATVLHDPRARRAIAEPAVSRGSRPNVDTARVRL